MSLNVLNKTAPKPSLLSKLLTKPKLTKEQRLSRPPEKASKKFPLTKKEIQVVHVATIHLNIWLLDALGDYPEIEELYTSLKSVSWTYYKSWDTEVAYAQSNLNKLASKLPAEVKEFTIPAGNFYTDLEDEDENIESITEPSLKLIHINKFTDEKGISGWSLQRKKILGTDTVFTAKVKWIMPTMNPLIFGLSLIQILAESPNIDLKLRQKWLRKSVDIYAGVEKELGITDYSFKNSNILSSLYCNNMHQDYVYKGTLKSWN